MRVTLDYSSAAERVLGVWVRFRALWGTLLVVGGVLTVVSFFDQYLHGGGGGRSGGRTGSRGASSLDGPVAMWQVDAVLLAIGTLLVCAGLYQLVIAALHSVWGVHRPPGAPRSPMPTGTESSAGRPAAKGESVAAIVAMKHAAGRLKRPALYMALTAGLIALYFVLFGVLALGARFGFQLWAEAVAVMHPSWVGEVWRAQSVNTAAATISVSICLLVYGRVRGSSWARRVGWAALVMGAVMGVYAGAEISDAVARLTDKGLGRFPIFDSAQ